MIRFSVAMAIACILAVAVGRAAEVAVPPVTPTYLNAKVKDLDKVIQLEPGACLRGPLMLFDAKRKVVFALAPGVHYPMACGDQPGEPPQ